MEVSVKSQLIHGVAWNFLEKILIRGTSFFISIILARLLSPSDYGLIGMLAIFVAISNVFIEGGFAKALIQNQECREIDYSTAFVTNIGVSFVVYAILFFMAPLIADFYDEPILIKLTRILSFNFILGAFNIVQRAKLMAVVDFKSLAQINVISSILSGLIGILMAYMGFGVWALVGQSIGATLVLLILFPFYSKWSPSIKFSKEAFRRLFGYGSKLMATGVYAVIFNNISTLCIGKCYQSKQLGFYTRALQFADMMSMTVNDVLGTVTFPVLSQLQSDRERLVSVYQKSLYFTALLIFPIMILCALLARPIILVLLTEKWLPCVVLVQWLFLSRMFTPLSALNMNILNVIGRPDLYMKLDFAKAPLSIIILVITVPISIKAMVIGSFVSSFICFFINAYLPGKILGYGAMRQLKDWRYIILSILVMSSVVWIFLSVVSNIWTQLIGGGIIGLIVYIGCCLIFKVIDEEMLVTLKIKKRHE